MSISFEVLSRLAVHKDNEYFELEEGDSLTIWFVNGDFVAGEILEIRDYTILVSDLEDEKKEIPIAKIKDIEQN